MIATHCLVLCGKLHPSDPEKAKTNPEFAKYCFDAVSAKHSWTIHFMEMTNTKQYLIGFPYESQGSAI